MFYAVFCAGDFGRERSGLEKAPAQKKIPMGKLFKKRLPHQDISLLTPFTNV